MQSSLGVMESGFHAKTPPEQPLCNLESVFSQITQKQPFPVFCKNGHSGEWKLDGNWIRCLPKEDVCSCKLSRKTFIGKLGELVKIAFIEEISKQENNEEKLAETLEGSFLENKEVVTKQIISTGQQLAALTFHQISSHMDVNEGSSNKKQGAQNKEIQTSLAPFVQVQAWTQTEMVPPRTLVQERTQTVMVPPRTNTSCAPPSVCKAGNEQLTRSREGTSAMETFKDILLRNKICLENQEAAAEAIQNLRPPPRKQAAPSKYFPSRKQTLENPELDAVYVGMQRQDLGKARRQLAALGLDCRRVHNVHFIGVAIAEIMTDKNYKEEFERICRSFGFSILKGYNPAAAPRNSNVPDTLEKTIKKNFTQRMESLLKFRVNLTKPTTLTQFKKDPVVSFVVSKLGKADISIDLEALLAGQTNGK